MRNIVKLEEILKQLHHVSGFHMTLFDEDGTSLCSYPRELMPFCSLIQSQESSKKVCKSFDRKALEHVKKSDELYIYRCHCGLFEAVAPLYDFGVLTGFLMMGQVLDSGNSNKKIVFEQAKKYVDNTELLKKTIAHIPIKTEEQIRACSYIMNLCAGYLSLSNHLQSDRQGLAQKVKVYMEQNYKKEITLEKLCKEYYCSRATLTSTFKKAQGETVVEYLTKVRCNAAMEQLEHGNLKIGEIATQCGFQDQNYFSKVFKKIYGIAPGSVRKKVGKGQA